MIAIPSNFGIQYATKKAHPRSKFSEEEDELLQLLVQTYGTKDWQTISRHMPDRNARQCRDRWQNYLSPSVVNGPWTEEEEELLVQKYEELGPSWKQIASFFPTRTDINIKSRWHLRERRIKKKDLQMKKEMLKQQTKNGRPMNSMLQSNLLQQQNLFIPQYSPNTFTPPPFNHYQMPQIQRQPIIEPIIQPQIEASPVPNNEINSEPLPFFTEKAEVKEESNINRHEAFDEDSNLEDCWSSLLMNEENSNVSNYFDWF